MGSAGQHQAAFEDPFIGRSESRWNTGEPADTPQHPEHAKPRKTAQLDGSAWISQGVSSLGGEPMKKPAEDGFRRRAGFSRLGQTAKTRRGRDRAGEQALQRVGILRPRRSQPGVSFN
jgi:hypothetical protein